MNLLLLKQHLESQTLSAYRLNLFRHKVNLWRTKISTSFLGIRESIHCNNRQSNVTRFSRMSAMEKKKIIILLMSIAAIYDADLTAQPTVTAVRLMSILQQ